MNQPRTTTRGSAVRPRRPRYPLGRLLRANLYDFGLLLRESAVPLSGFALLTIVGVVYLRFLYRAAPAPLGFAEAFYETLRLLTFQSELPFPDGDLVGEALFFVMPLLGLALIFQGVLNFGRLLLDKGSRRETWQIALASTYRDHLIVCGLGRVSLRVVSQLAASGFDVVVVERDWESEFVERTLNLKVPVVMGDAREPQTLLRAGLLRAHAVIAATADDLLNVEIALMARSQRATRRGDTLRVILRVFNDELDRNLERTLGPNAAFSASALAAPTYAAATISREIEHVLPFGGTLIGVTRLVVQQDSLISGFAGTIEEQHGIRVLHHRDPAGRTHRTRTMHQLNAGDEITVLGSLDSLEELRAKNRPGSRLAFLQPHQLQRPSERIHTVIVCGLGKVGYRVVRQLWQLSPRPRIVVVRGEDTNPQFVARISRLDGITTIVGDAREGEVLRSAGIDQADSVAALTSNDLVNLQIGLAARRARADVHVVLRVFSDVLANRLADLFGIRTAYSTSALAAPTLAAAAAIGDVRHALVVGDQIFGTVRLVVGPGDALDGPTVAEIRERYGLLILGLRRGGQPWPVPALDTALACGDEVAVLGPLPELDRLRAEASARRAAARGSE